MAIRNSPSTPDHPLHQHTMRGIKLHRPSSSIHQIQLSRATYSELFVLGAKIRQVRHTPQVFRAEIRCFFRHFFLDTCILLSIHCDVPVLGGRPGLRHSFPIGAESQPSLVRRSASVRSPSRVSSDALHWCEVPAESRPALCICAKSQPSLVRRSASVRSSSRVSSGALHWCGVPAESRLTLCIGAVVPAESRLACCIRAVVPAECRQPCRIRVAMPPEPRKGHSLPSSVAILPRPVGFLRPEVQKTGRR